MAAISSACFQTASRAFSSPLEGPSLLLLVEGHFQRQSGGPGESMHQPIVLLFDGPPGPVPHGPGPDVAGLAGLVPEKPS